MLIYNTIGDKALYKFVVMECTMKCNGNFKLVLTVIHSYNYYVFSVVNILQEISLHITKASHSFFWENYGFKLQVPPHSLPNYINSCIITIKIFLSGQNKLPPDTELVSPIFWLKCEPNVYFDVPLSLEIEHCAPPESYPDLTMARALCTKDNLPGSFEILYGGKFNTKKYGVLKLSHFSCFSILLRKIIPWRREYWYKVFYMAMGRSIKIHFTITWNDEAHKTVSNDCSVSLRVVVLIRLCKEG